MRVYYIHILQNKIRVTVLWVGKRSLFMWYCCNLIIKKAVISGFEKNTIVLLNGDNASATFFNWLIMDFVCKKKFKKIILKSPPLKMSWTVTSIMVLLPCLPFAGFLLHSGRRLSCLWLLHLNPLCEVGVMIYRTLVLPKYGPNIFKISQKSDHLENKTGASFINRTIISENLWTVP